MQNEKIATRVAYGRALAALGEKYDFFVMDADLSGSTQTAMFGKKFPSGLPTAASPRKIWVSSRRRASLRRAAGVRVVVRDVRVRPRV